MSRSVHTSRAKFRKAAEFDYSTEEERLRVLGKIIDEGLLKRELKEIARRRRQLSKAGLKDAVPKDALVGLAWKKGPVSDLAKAIVTSHRSLKDVRKR